jgi:hypothetical protein
MEGLAPPHLWPLKRGCSRILNPPGNGFPFICSWNGVWLLLLWKPLKTDHLLWWVFLPSPQIMTSLQVIHPCCNVQRLQINVLQKTVIL